MKKFSPVLLLLAGLLAGAPSLTSCNSDSIFEQQEKLVEEQKKTDDATIQAYLSRHNITSSQYSRQPSGIYLVSLTDGPATNPLIKPGQKVTTNYVGRFISTANDGVAFGSSSANRTTCGCDNFYAGQATFTAPTGVQQAVPLMRKGDRKLVLIPSYLLLTPQGQFILPQTAPQPLLYDIEILNVE